MTGIIISNNEYQVNTGNTKIEYASSGNCVGYSMWGEDIPYTDVWKSITRQELFTEFPDIYRNGSSTSPMSGEVFRHKVENLLKNGSGGGSGDNRLSTYVLQFNLTKPVKITYVSIHGRASSAGGIIFTTSADDNNILNHGWGGSSTADLESTQTWSGELIAKNTLTVSLWCEYLRGGNLSGLQLTMFTKK